MERWHNFSFTRALGNQIPQIPKNTVLMDRNTHCKHTHTLKYDSALAIKKTLYGKLMISDIDWFTSSSHEPAKNKSGLYLITTSKGNNNNRRINKAITFCKKKIKSIFRTIEIFCIVIYHEIFAFQILMKIKCCIITLKYVYLIEMIWFKWSKK